MHSSLTLTSSTVPSFHFKSSAASNCAEATSTPTKVPSANRTSPRYRTVALNRVGPLVSTHGMPTLSVTPGSFVSVLRGASVVVERDWTGVCLSSAGGRGRSMSVPVCRVGMVIFARSVLTDVAVFTDPVDIFDGLAPAISAAVDGRFADTPPLSATPGVAVAGLVAEAMEASLLVVFRWAATGDLSEIDLAGRLSCTSLNCFAELLDAGVREEGPLLGILISFLLGDGTALSFEAISSSAAEDVDVETGRAGSARTDGDDLGRGAVDADDCDLDACAFPPVRACDAARSREERDWLSRGSEDARLTLPSKDVCNEEEGA